MAKPRTSKVPLEIAIKIAGEDRWAHAPKPTRDQYAREGIPASQIADDLLAWYMGERGKLQPEPAPPPEPDEILMIKRAIDADLRPAVEHPKARETEWAVLHLVQQISGLARLIAPPLTLTPVKKRRSGRG